MDKKDKKELKFFDKIKDREYLVDLLTCDGANKFYATMIAILIGLLFGFIIMLVTNPSNAFAGIITILTGGLNHSATIHGTGATGIGDILYYTCPILLTGLAVGFAFRTGLFNIGASGQFIVGAFVSLYVIFAWTFLPSSIRWIFAMLAGGVAGGLWAVLPGVFKAIFNVHEVISTIMMNYIGIYLVNMLILKSPLLYDKSKNATYNIPDDLTLPKLGLDKIFPNSSVNIGILIAIVIAVIIFILLNKTTIGYELKACGHNKEASKYAGISEKKSIVLAMVISGGLAGLSGALVFLADVGRNITVVDILPYEGFSGITVALLGMSNPIAIIFTAFFISFINQGGFYMTLNEFYPEIVEIITSVIIYASSFAMFITLYFKKAKINRDEKLKKEGKKEEEMSEKKISTSLPKENRR